MKPPQWLVAAEAAAAVQRKPHDNIGCLAAELRYPCLLPPPPLSQQSASSLGLGRQPLSRKHLRTCNGRRPFCGLVRHIASRRIAAEAEATATAASTENSLRFHYVAAMSLPRALSLSLSRLLLSALPFPRPSLCFFSVRGATSSLL